MARFCSTIRCNEEKDMIVGNSTSCSASCVSRTTVRTGTSSGRILGTSITCSGSGKSVPKNCARFGNCSTICGAGSSRNCTNAHKVDNVLHSVPLGPLLRPDASEEVRPRPGGRYIFDVKGKVLSACRLGGGMLRNVAVKCCSFPPPGPVHPLTS